MQRILLPLFFFVVSASALAQDAQMITRREGFLLIWEAIDRPAEETRETPYVDVPEGERGSFEITYAKRRGLLDDEDDHFYPDESLTLGDALIWLLRTRNVADPDEITLHLLPGWLEKYPIASIDDVPQKITTEELTLLMQRFDQLLRDEVHEVSLYSEKFHGKGTAFGETFDMYAMTAAHRTFPHNTVVKVTNVENGKSVTVRINDRGPFVEGRDMDLSLGAFTMIAERSKGVIRARFERMGTATEEEGEEGEKRQPARPRSDGEGQEGTALLICPEPTAYSRRIGGGVALHRGIPNVFPIHESLRFSAPKPFVVRSILGPDGTVVRGQDFVVPGEVFSFVPVTEGNHVIHLGSVFGRTQRVTVQAMRCVDTTVE